MTCFVCFVLSSELAVEREKVLSHFRPERTSERPHNSPLRAMQSGIDKRPCRIFPKGLFDPYTSQVFPNYASRNAPKRGLKIAIRNLEEGWQGCLAFLASPLVVVAENADRCRGGQGPSEPRGQPLLISSTRAYMHPRRRHPFLPAPLGRVRKPRREPRRAGHGRCRRHGTCAPRRLTAPLCLSLFGRGSTGPLS